MSIRMIATVSLKARFSIEKRTGSMQDVQITSIGKEVRRNEDRRLITGHGRYSADINLPGQAFAKIVRSPYAHAAILKIDQAGALAVPGVLRILTGADLVAANIGPIVHDHGLLGSKEAQKQGPDIFLENRDGSSLRIPPHNLLAIERARFVGEAVAIVIADSVAAANDAAEMVLVEYEELPFVVTAADAIKGGAPLVWDDIPHNTSVDAEVGNRQATEEAFASAPHVVRFETVVQRIAGVPMEPRAAVGAYDSETGRYTLYAGCSGVFRHKNELSAILRVPMDKVRVVANDVGGSFGTRNAFYPEFGLVVWGSRLVGRPVKWISDRLECFLSDYQGRDLTVEAELAFDDTGRFLALRGTNTSNLGAYAASHIPLRKGVGLMSSVYDIPSACFIARGVLSNTVPTAPVRSAGRPEAIFVIERLVDLAAREINMDPVEIRRVNLIDPTSFPYKNPLGLVYDNGEYAACMDSALQLADWGGFPARRAKARARGKLRGIGLANYVEITTGPPTETAVVTVHPDGFVDIAIGTVSSGQGHETSFAQLITEWLGVPVDKVRLLSGDTDKVSMGGGSVSGRSMRFASVVIGKAVEQIVERGRQAAAYFLQVPEAQVTFAEGQFRAASAQQGFTVAELARRMQEQGDLPEQLRGPLKGEWQQYFKEAGFPYGSQICEVEIDPETGEIEIETVVCMDDVGRAVNPMILHGQAHGGAAMGIGQALMEQIQYDRQTGQMLTGSFMDYTMPRAMTMPFFRVGISEVPSPSNPLGIRAGGEGGTTPALAVVVNAVVNALTEFGIRHIEMPVTAHSVWNAIRQSKAAAPASQ
jgi:carbon-monoxide dehydrogenase large subunit